MQRIKGALGRKTEKPDPAAILLATGYSSGNIVMQKVVVGANKTVLVESLIVIKQAHDFGVNSLAFKRMNGGCAGEDQDPSQETFVIASGGDDQMLSVNLVRCTRTLDGLEKT